MPFNVLTNHHGKRFTFEPADNNQSEKLDSGVGAKRRKQMLVYTTHDTTLLDKHFFRRDQIWFADKDEYGCSQLYALSDFKVRSDASFEKDYLAGVYGAIPVLKDFDFKKDE